MTNEEKLAAKREKIEAKLKKKAENAATMKTLWNVMTASQINATRVIVIKRLNIWQKNGDKRAAKLLNEIADTAPCPQDRCEAALYIEDSAHRKEILKSTTREALVHPLTTEGYDMETWVERSGIPKTDLIGDTEIDEEFRCDLARSLKGDLDKRQFIGTDEFFSPINRCWIAATLKDEKTEKEILKECIGAALRSEEMLKMKYGDRIVAKWFNQIGDPAFTYETLASHDDPELVINLYYRLNKLDTRLTVYCFTHFWNFSQYDFEKFEGTQEDYAELALSAIDEDVRKKAFERLDERSEDFLLAQAESGNDDALVRLLEIRPGKYGDKFYDRLTREQRVEEICAGGLPEHRIDCIRELINSLERSSGIEVTESIGKDLARIYRAYKYGPDSRQVRDLYIGIIGKTYKKHFDHGSCDSDGGKYDVMREYTFNTYL